MAIPAAVSSRLLHSPALLRIVVQVSLAMLLLGCCPALMQISSYAIIASMLTLTHQPNLFQRFIQKLAATRSVSWFLSHVLHHFDRAIDQISRGRINLTQIVSGLPVVMLTTIGAKTGQHRTVPLVAIPDGDNVVLIASWFGNHHHPAW